MKNELTEGDIDLLFKAVAAYEREGGGDLGISIILSKMTGEDPRKAAKDYADRASKEVQKREMETIFLKAKLLGIKNYLAEHPEEKVTA